MPAATVAFRIAKETPPGWSGIVSAIWFGVGLAALLALTEYVHFTWTPTPGLHSWVTEHEYPIQQQIFWFYATIVGVPLGVVIGHFVRAASAALLAWSGVPSRIATRASVLCLLPLLIVWLPLSRLQPAGSLRALEAGTLGSMLALLVVAGASRTLAKKEDRQERALATSEPSEIETLESRSLLRSLTRAFVLLVLPFCLYLAVFDPRISRSVDVFHEAEKLIPLQEVLHGGVPYRDVYLQHGFLENLGIPWLGATLFSPTLAGVRWMEALVEPLGELGAYALVVGLTGARLLPALLIAVLLIASPVHVSSRAFFGLSSVAVLAGTLQRHRRRAPAPESGASFAGNTSPESGAPPAGNDAPENGGVLPCFCSGALAMAALLHSAEVGSYTLATGAVFLGIAGAADRSTSWSSRWKPLLGFLFGALLSSIPFAVALAAHGALDDFVLNTIVQMRYQLEIWGKPFPSVFRTFGPLLSGASAIDWGDRRFWWYFSPALLSASGAWLAHCAMRGRFRASPSAIPLFLLWLAAAFYFRSALGRSDPSHLHYAVLFPLLMLVFFADALWCRGVGFLKDSRASRRGAGAGLLLAAALVAMLPLAWEEHTAPRGLGVGHAIRELVPSRKRISFDSSLTDKELLPDSQRQGLDELADFLAAETTPEERVFDVTNQTARLFFVNRRSVTRYFHLVYAALPEMQQEVIQRLEEDRTRFVLARPEGMEARFDGVRYRERHPLIAEYLAANFSPFRTIGEVEVWKRNEPRT